MSAISVSLCIYCQGKNFGSNHLELVYIYKISAVLVTKLFFFFFPILPEWH